MTIENDTTFETLLGEHQTLLNNLLTTRASYPNDTTNTEIKDAEVLVNIKKDEIMAHVSIQYPNLCNLINFMKCFN